MALIVAGLLAGFPAAAHAQTAMPDYRDALKAFKKSGPSLRSEQILYGLVPDFKRLTLIPGEDLKTRYSGITIKGIYSVTPHGDQRYVEKMTPDGRTDYAEGKFSSKGDWYVEGDRLCFRYDEAPGTAHCSYEFDYGDCIISYSRIMGDKPLNPANWGSVNKIAPDGFTREDLSLETEQDFSCRDYIG